ncbi:MAG: hypothetical protein EOO11_03935 [Chitinophagaceae bacterium]|nr:MAG: hypothetical protein EOO11_03935 [Chitinophagaceae bacterium]
MRCLALPLLLLAATAASGQVYKNPKAPVEARAAALLAQMTLEEKIDYIGGYNDFYIRPIDRLGLPAIKMTDGPVGTRNDGRTTAYPASVLTAATWDTALARRLGTALGRDARARGVHILLAPGVNIYRAPMNGRNFEYLGEDPYLAARMAVPYIQGVQQQRVVATVKHYAANNQEWDRHNVSSDLDERTLQELYLPAFKAAVQEARVGAVMNSYNLVNGVHASQHPHLNNEILKGKWGFPGILMSDWTSTYDAVGAANGGLDLEMPSGLFMNRRNLLPAIRSGKVSVATIDDKVRRILRTIFRFGFYGRVQKDSSIALNDPANAAVALDLARGGIVLLKNEGGLLPLSKGTQRIALFGPNADRYVAGGGSSQTEPFAATTLLQALQSVGGTEVLHIKGTVGPMEEYAEGSPLFVAPGSGEKGLKAEYFNNQQLSGAPAATRNEPVVNHTWGAEPDVAGIGADHFSARYTGVLRPAKSGPYKLAVRGDDGFRLWVGDQKMIDLWNDHGATLRTYTMDLEAGREYPVRLEFYENGGSAQIALAAYIEHIDFSEATQAAKAADVAIVAVGFDPTSESEGFDRTFGLPEYQDTLINAIAKANPNTIVVLNAGGNVDMRRWLGHVKGLLHAWYPGQEGNRAVAEILFGDVNPSGKLPASFEKAWEDNPAFPYYHDADGNKRVTYGEGLYVGYRHYDRSAVKPQFAFGFGLSYSSFAYSGLRITAVGKGSAVVRFTIRNTGTRSGAEVAQVYVSQPSAPVVRPLKELKGFTKLMLRPGESRTVTIPLAPSAFSYYKTSKAAFGYDPGRFAISVGPSSDSMLLKGEVTIR